MTEEVGPLSFMPGRRLSANPKCCSAGLADSRSATIVGLSETPGVASPLRGAYHSGVKSRQFVHLHLHTCFSLLDGACKIDPLMTKVVEADMPAVAITDHGVMYGIVDFYQTALKRGVKPILGCEVYVTNGDHRERGPEARRIPLHHLVLLATDNTGYRNLVKLVSRAHLDGFYYKPRIDKPLLAEHAKGLIGLSSCLKGELASLLTGGHRHAATEVAGQYRDILGDGNFYLEIQDHGLTDQRRTNPLIIEIAKKNGLPLVATNDVHYLEREHAAAHEVLLCLQTQTVMSDPKRMRYQTEEFYLKTRAEMEALFADVPEALDNTLDIAERCNVELALGDKKKLHFPVFELPSGTTQEEYLIERGLEGLGRLYGISDPHHPSNDREKDIVQRFHDEIAVIRRTRFINYFLVVWDFVRFAREQGIAVGPGRGSGGGSIVAYALGITAIDPIHYSLIFERFLNPERVSPPDFDIDFCQSRREEVIDYVKRKYGEDSVAQIITFGSLGPKMAIRDVGRVLEIPYAKCDQLSKMVPDDPKMTLAMALEQSPELKRAAETDEDCRRILPYALVLEGLYRNPGTHAAGVVIGERPLFDIIPLALDKEKQRITQFTMHPIEDIGLLKMDFLGLKTLTVLQEAVQRVRETTGREIDLENLPLDDKPTYALLNRGDTVGVFQLESSGMRDLIRRIRVDRIEDLIAVVALYRPGPMNMLPDYVDRKLGNARIKYDHPLLTPILKETYGVMVYQEQVQKAANVLAGYSLGEADILRRAMGKKIPAVMEQQRAKFVEGCAKTSRIGSRRASAIFDTMAKFAGYGFNKAHSAGYAIIAYQTAYLKANYPAEFMAALLSCEMGNFDKLPVFIQEARNIGLDILPPDVNASGVRFMPAGRAIRFGLAGIKNVGEGAAEAIVREREEGRPYSGLIDLCSRLVSQETNKKVLESLVRCGALDTLDPNRARLFNGIDFAMSRAATALRDRESGQGNLFDLLEADPEADRPDSLPESDEWPENVLLAGERELLGIYLSGHPLTRYADLLRRYELCSVSGLDALREGARTRVGGILSKITRRVTRSKKMMAVVHLEDLEGSVESLVFPDTFETYGPILEQDAAVLVCGEVQRRDDQVKLLAQEIYSLEEAPKHFTTRIGIHVPASAGQETMDRVKQILRVHPGQTPVVLCLQFAKGEKVFVKTSDAYRVLAGEALVAELEGELGERTVYVAVNPEPFLTARARRRNGNSYRRRRN